MMRRIIESTLLSPDGVIGNPHTCASARFDEEARATAFEQLQASDAMLIGRTTYEIFSGLWPTQTGSYADAINAIPKHVFSSTLTDTHWTNSRIVRRDVADEVKVTERARRFGGGVLLAPREGSARWRRVVAVGDGVIWQSKTPAARNSDLGLR